MTEKQIADQLFKVGAVSIYLTKKAPAYLRKMAKELSSDEKRSLKASMQVAKAYKADLKEAIEAIEANGWNEATRDRLTSLIKKGVSFLSKARKRLGEDRFNKLTLNITDKPRYMALLKKEGFNKARLNSLLKGQKPNNLRQDDKNLNETIKNMLSYDNRFNYSNYDIEMFLKNNGYSEEEAKKITANRGTPERKIAINKLLNIKERKGLDKWRGSKAEHVYDSLANTMYLSPDRINYVNDVISLEEALLNPNTSDEKLISLYKKLNYSDIMISSFIRDRNKNKKLNNDFGLVEQGTPDIGKKIDYTEQDQNLINYFEKILPSLPKSRFTDSVLPSQQDAATLLERFRSAITGENTYDAAKNEKLKQATRKSLLDYKQTIQANTTALDKVVSMPKANSELANNLENLEAKEQARQDKHLASLKNQLEKVKQAVRNAYASLPSREFGEPNIDNTKGRRMAKIQAKVNERISNLYRKQIDLEEQIKLHGVGGAYTKNRDKNTSTIENEIAKFKEELKNTDNNIIKGNLRNKIKTREQALEKRNKTIAYAEENPPNAKLQSLIDTGEVKQWDKMPIYYFVKGANKVALMMGKDGNIKFTKKYPPSSEQEQQAIKNRLGI